MPAAKRRAGGQRLPVSCPALARFRLDGPAVPGPSPTPMREPCSLALSNAFVALCATSETSLGTVRKRTTASGHNGPSPPAHEPQIWGQRWHVGVGSGHGVGHGAPPGVAQGQAQQHWTDRLDPGTVSGLGSLCHTANVMRCGFTRPEVDREHETVTSRHEQAGEEGLPGPVERNPSDKGCCKHELPSPSSVLFCSHSDLRPASKQARLGQLAQLAHRHDGCLEPLSGSTAWSSTTQLL